VYPQNRQSRGPDVYRDFAAMTFGHRGLKICGQNSVRSWVRSNPLAVRYFDAFPEVLTEETITFRLPITFTLN